MDNTHIYTGISLLLLGYPPQITSWVLQRVTWPTGVSKATAYTTGHTRQNAKRNNGVTNVPVLHMYAALHVVSCFGCILDGMPPFLLILLISLII
jgi:hypothetical protein